MTGNKVYPILFYHIDYSEVMNYLIVIKLRTSAKVDESPVDLIAQSRDHKKPRINSQKLTPVIAGNRNTPLMCSGHS